MGCNCAGQNSSGSTFTVTMSDGSTKVYLTAYEARAAVTRSGGTATIRENPPA